MPARIITSPRTLTRPRRRLWKHHSDQTFSHINWYLKKNVLFVTYTIIQSITSSEICALHLTHPSAHTPGAVGSQHCGSRGAVGGSVPLLKCLTSVVDNSCRSRDSNPQPRVTSATLYPLGHNCPERFSSIALYHHYSLWLAHWNCSVYEHKELQSAMKTVQIITSHELWSIYWEGCLRKSWPNG